MLLFKKLSTKLIKTGRNITKPISSFYVLLICISFNSEAAVFPVKSFDNFNKAQQRAVKGDSIVWQSGTYSDVNLDILTSGLIFCSEEPGSVIFTGQSGMNLFADSVLLTGFQFMDGNTKGDILKVSGSYNVMENLNFSNYESHYYLNILPGSQYNQVVRCNFEKKPETSTTSVLEIQVHPTVPGYHLVQYCSFKNHTAPPGAGGDYGIEALRIGYSFQSKFISRTIVEYCYFTKCKGDGEIISSKARENIFRYNTFENNDESHFTLRHGSDNAVYGNFFLEGAGIRIKEGQNQMVYNNYFNTGEWFAINLMNHRADPLENIIVAHNTFVNSGPILLGGRGEYQPEKVTMVNNLFLDPAASIISDPTGDEFFSGNALNESAKNLPEGFDRIELKVEKNSFGLHQPEEAGELQKFYSSDYPELLDIPTLDDDPFIEMDILRQTRSSDKAQFVGCFVPGESAELKPYATAENTGPDY